MGDVEFGKCDICKNEDYIQRKYFRYPIKCECHSPEHFEIVYHCKNCIPIEPRITKITLRTSELTDIVRSAKLKKIKNNLNDSTK